MFCIVSSKVLTDDFRHSLTTSKRLFPFSKHIYCDARLYDLQACISNWQGGTTWTNLRKSFWCQSVEYSAQKVENSDFAALATKRTSSLALTRTPLQKIHEHRIPASFMVPRRGNPWNNVKRS